ncbi:MAG: site-specific integrase [Anaeroplasmataceae bacterium]|nr:site-specific integrase [Anaeroplasmataceae bacterium]MDE5868458.1 site-specific integrase [Anaeroplasmataceae bacterium]
MKLKELLQIWLTKYAKPTLKVRSFNKYQSLVSLHISPVIGQYDIKDITSDIIQDYLIEKLKSGNMVTHQPLAVNTIYSIVSILKQTFKLACNLELISKNPTQAIKLPPSKEKDIYALSREEQKRIEEFCLKSYKNNYLGFIICLYTGIRLGELLALTWEDVDFTKKYLYVKKTSYTLSQNNKRIIVIDTPKTKKSIRVIPLPDKLLNLLEIYKNNSNCKYIIHTYKNKMVETRSYQRTFDSVLRKCKIKHYNFHCLRHTFVTRALELGIDIKTLSEILGHTNVSITLNRYAHSLLEYKIEQMNKIAQIL